MVHLGVTWSVENLERTNICHQVHSTCSDIFLIVTTYILPIPYENHKQWPFDPSDLDRRHGRHPSNSMPRYPRKPPENQSASLCHLKIICTKFEDVSPESFEEISGKLSVTQNLWPFWLQWPSVSSWLLANQESSVPHHENKLHLVWSW